MSAREFDHHLDNSGAQDDDDRKNKRSAELSRKLISPSSEAIESKEEDYQSSFNTIIDKNRIETRDKPSRFTKVKDFVKIGKGEGNHRSDTLKGVVKQFKDTLQQMADDIRHLPSDLKGEFIEATLSLINEVTRAYEQAMNHGQKQETKDRNLGQQRLEDIATAAKEMREILITWSHIRASLIQSRESLGNLPTEIKDSVPSQKLEAGKTDHPDVSRPEASSSSDKQRSPAPLTQIFEEIQDDFEKIEADLLVSAQQYSKAAIDAYKVRDNKNIRDAKAKIKEIEEVVPVNASFAQFQFAQAELIQQADTHDYLSPKLKKVFQEAMQSLGEAFRDYRYKTIQIKSMDASSCLKRLEDIKASIKVIGEFLGYLHQIHGFPHRFQIALRDTHNRHEESAELFVRSSVTKATDQFLSLLYWVSREPLEDLQHGEEAKDFQRTHQWFEERLDKLAERDKALTKETIDTFRQEHQTFVQWAKSYLEKEGHVDDVPSEPKAFVQWGRSYLEKEGHPDTLSMVINQVIKHHELFESVQTNPNLMTARQAFLQSIRIRESIFLTSKQEMSAYTALIEAQHNFDDLVSAFGEDPPPGRYSMARFRNDNYSRIENAQDQWNNRNGGKNDVVLIMTKAVNDPEESLIDEKKSKLSLIIQKSADSVNDSVEEAKEYFKAKIMREK